jgi:hypothetical protein
MVLPKKKASTKSQAEVWGSQSASNAQAKISQERRSLCNRTRSLAVGASKWDAKFY